MRECYPYMLSAICVTDCHLLCCYVVPGTQRLCIFKEFHMLPNITEQNIRITQLVKLRVVKKNDGTIECCPLYHLMTKCFDVEVCRTFFINTLGITESRLKGVLNPINYSWYSDSERALKAKLPNQIIIICKSLIMNDFIKEPLEVFEDNGDLHNDVSVSEVNLEPNKKYKKKVLPNILRSARNFQKFKKKIL